MYYQIFNVDSTQCHLFKGMLKNCRHLISWSRISKSDRHGVLCLVLFTHTIRSLTSTRNQVDSAGSRCNMSEAEMRSSIELSPFLEQYCLCPTSPLFAKVRSTTGNCSFFKQVAGGPGCSWEFPTPRRQQ